MSVREAAVAGLFYPASALALRHTVQGYLVSAHPPSPGGRLRALVAPHAGHLFCGKVMGSAFSLLQELDRKVRWRIVHLGPSHHAHFQGLATALHQSWRTPLGLVPAELPDQLLGSPLVRVDAEAHQLEHCLEAQLPFLQLALASFFTVPLLIGLITPEDLAGILEPLISPDTVFVVSSDLSHYYNETHARELDGAAHQAILELHPEKLKAQSEACGMSAIQALILLAQRRGWQSNLLDYATSAEAYGDTSQVVGYGAYAFTEHE